MEDIDAVDSSKSKITLSKKKMIALPHWRANPVTEPSALHQINSQVMALYPQTTCFYKGTVAAVPEKPNEDYIVLFEDSTYPMGYSPPMPVAQKYIGKESLVTSWILVIIFFKLVNLELSFKLNFLMRNRLQTPRKEKI